MVRFFNSKLHHFSRFKRWLTITFTAQKNARPHRKIEDVSALSPLVIGAFLILSKVLLHLNLPNLTVDINATARLPFYTGFISQLGLFCWFSTASLCFFASIERRASVSTERSEIKRFLAVSARCLLVLGLDDAFMIHERVMPLLGISEHSVMIFYALGLILYLHNYREIIARTRYFCLIWATLFFAISVSMDTFLNQAPSIEDAAKFVGIFGLACYFFVVADTEMKRDVQLTQRENAEASR